MRWVGFNLRGLITRGAGVPDPSTVKTSALATMRGGGGCNATAECNT